MGRFTDPRDLGEEPAVELPERFRIDDSGVLLPAPPQQAASVQIERGPNILPMPLGTPLEDSLEARVALKVGDNITTDHIMPAGAKILPLRSNIPAISEHCFVRCDEEFPARCKKMGKGIIIGGSNYGQGSSREHAALAPLYLGVKAVIVKSFARIHVANLINAGILPLTFKNEADYDRISLMDEVVLPDVRACLEQGRDVTLENRTTGESFPLNAAFSRRQVEMLLAGGLLDYTRNQNG